MFLYFFRGFNWRKNCQHNDGFQHNSYINIFHALSLYKRVYKIHSVATSYYPTFFYSPRKYENIIFIFLLVWGK